MGDQAQRQIDRIAESIWREMCPGIRMTDEDWAHYRQAARAAVETLFALRPSAELVEALEEAMLALAMCEPRTAHGAECQRNAIHRARAALKAAKP